MTLPGAQGVQRIMKFDRTRLIFGLYLLVLIVLFEVVAGALHVPAWPAFIAMIFFFAEHMDPKKAVHILVGGVFGIGCILLAKPIIGALAPLLGMELARLAFIVILVYAIVAFGEMLPALFNNYAFMYLTVTGLAVQLPNPNPFLLMAVAAVGGAILIGGVIGIGRIMMMQAAAKQPSATPS
jgi:Protein of unknown function (DUF1097)